MELKNASKSLNNGPDVSQVVGVEWPLREFPSTPGERGEGFQVVCRRSVLASIYNHGQENTSVEICGVLVGQVCRDERGPFLSIEGCIRGEHAGNLAAQVTFTSETWTYIHEQMERFPGLRIVGWYHTHPDFGIFLSAADLFIHENFFAQPWQVALVYDPVRVEEGMFLWRQGRAKQEGFLVEEDMPDYSPAMAAAARGEKIIISESLEKRVAILERRSRWYGWVLVFALLVIGGLAWIARAEIQGQLLALLESGQSKSEPTKASSGSKLHDE